MSRRRTRGSNCADLNLDLRTNPDPRWVRHVEGPHWRAPDAVVYRPWIELSPAEAVAQLRQGARVVYDRGGGDVTWLTPDELDELESAPPPDLHPSKDGLARLEGWRTAEGQVLIVAVGEVSWGHHIRG